MTICELCGREVHRRRVNQVYEKWVCWSCNWYLGLMDDDPLQCLGQINRLEKRVSELSEEVYKKNSAKPKLCFSNPYSSVPPMNVISNTLLALDIEGKYVHFSDVLADYYGIPVPRYWDNEAKVPDGAVACYYPPPTNTVYSKGKLNRETAFHEFYHALQHLGVVPNPASKEEREGDANKYAKACMFLAKKLEATQAG